MRDDADLSPGPWPAEGCYARQILNRHNFIKEAKIKHLILLLYVKYFFGILYKNCVYLMVVGRL